jgi:DNA mismatch repair ATPase MutS
VNNNPIKNDYTLDKHLLITGPNAAGKTTLLKTTIFNIILSQQVGGGFYKSAKINPYDIIHCYINIPDTSARDSLFQAEARRCKNILTQIAENSNKIRHFCVFDELYSGTNPYEAIGSAFAFLTYLNKHKNVKFILTTHYLDLCKRLEGSEESVETVENYNMKIITDVNNDFKYTYKLQHGISHIKGGVKVLKDLDYPKEIIERTTDTIKELIL